MCPYVTKPTYIADLAKRLSGATGKKITEAQLEEWLFGEKNAPGRQYVSDAIHDFLGDRVYKAVTRAGKIFVGVIEAKLAKKKFTRIGREEIEL